MRLQIVLSWALVLVTFMARAGDVVDTIVVRKAQLNEWYADDVSALFREPYSSNLQTRLEKKCIALLLGSHTVSNGMKWVIAIRKYRNKEGVTDNEIFEKLTLELPALEYGREMSVDSAGVRGVISIGNPSSMKGCMGFRSVTPKGTVMLTKRLDDDESLVINVTASMEYLGSIPTPPYEFAIKGQLPVRHLDVAKLTPWLGGAVSDARWRLMASPH